MTHYYSDTKKAFYVEELREMYELSGNWPEDAVSLTEEEYKVLYESLMDGKKTLKVDKKGTVKAVPLPAAEMKVLDKETERFWRNGELERADTMIKLAEDDENVGTVQEWRQYRVALRKWPEHKSFPKENFRPQAPTPSAQ